MPMLVGSRAWQAMLRRWLLHRVDVVRTSGVNEYGKPQDGQEVSAVPCFISGSKARILTAEGVDMQADASIDFPHEIQIKLNDKVRNGRGRDGSVLLQEGRVIRVDDIDHPEHGSLVQTALVQRA